MPAKIKITGNMKAKQRQIRKFAKQLNKEGFKQAMSDILFVIGETSVGDFMLKVPSTDRHTFPTGHKLRIRSHRLAASIQGVMIFKFGKFVTSKSGKTTKVGIKSAKGKREAIREIKWSPNHVDGIIGSTTPYAGIHEFGGRTGRNLKTMIPARPYLKPAIMKSIPDMHNIFEEMIETGWRRTHV